MSSSSRQSGSAPKAVGALLPVSGNVYEVTEPVLAAIEGRASEVALAYARGVAVECNQRLRVGAVNGGRPLFGHHDAEADAAVAASNSSGGAAHRRRQ